MIRSTPEDAKGTTYDKLCEYVKLCQAAESVRAKSMVTKHNGFATLVGLLESYDIDIPALYFRSSALQFCQSELRQSHLDLYLDAAACYIDSTIDKSDPEEQTFDVKKPQLRMMQPTIGDAEDEIEYGDFVNLTFYNDTVLLLVKSDKSLDTLQPLAQLCRSILKRHDGANIEKWAKEVEGTPIASSWNNVVKACRGFLAFVSSIPLELGAGKDEADFVTSGGLRKKRKRWISQALKKSGEEAKEGEPKEEEAEPDAPAAAEIKYMVDISDTARAMQRYITTSEGIWPKLVDAYQTQQLVDAAWAPKLAQTIETIDGLLTASERPLDAADAAAMTQAITTMHLADS